MLICRFVNNTPVIEVIQVSMTFGDTSNQYWYFDTENWTRSLLGNQNEEPTQPMTKREIEWAKANYLPKAQQTEVI